jgi:hypothetical protein
MVHSFILLKPLSNSFFQFNIFIVSEALEQEEKQIIRINGRRLEDREICEMEFKINAVEQGVSETCERMKDALNSLTSIASSK